MAGLLAHPVFYAFPLHHAATVAVELENHYYGLTAAGTAPEFNRIPSSFYLLNKQIKTKFEAKVIRIMD